MVEWANMAESERACLCEEEKVGVGLRVLLNAREESIPRSETLKGSSLEAFRR